MKHHLEILLILAISFMPALGDRYHSKQGHGDRGMKDEGIDYWNNVGAQEIKRAKEMTDILNKRKAKNIILFVGDGMSLPTLTASRIYKAQKQVNFDGSVSGEESLLFFENFPYVALSKTYSVDHQTPDSASTATAMFTGVKTNSGTIGYDNKIREGDASSIVEATPLKSILVHAQEAGKDTGFVTTTRITHATPASLYAHSADRDWECYQDIEDENLPEDVHEIAWQLMYNEPGNAIKVMLGGGLKAFRSESNNDGKSRGDYDDYDSNCYTKDKDFVLDFQASSSQNVFVMNKTELLSVDPSQTERLLGLFSDTHCIFDHERVSGVIENYQDSPSLSDMTHKAIEMLSKNQDQGFFLMVEGGRIDHAHHNTWVNAALDETVAFDKAIETAYNMVDTDETLIIVTADHGHTMSMSGYPQREYDPNNKGSDGLPRAILSYANGQGFDDHIYVNYFGQLERSDLREMDMTDFYFYSPSSAPKSSETHSGADVGIFAQGPFAHLFHGVHEQIFIYHVMAFSACLDKYADEDHCYQS